MKIKRLILLLLTLLILCSCSSSVNEDVITVNLESTTDVTEEYLSLGGTFKENAREYKCYDVTPKEFKDYGFRIFNADGFLYICHEGKLYSAGLSHTSFVCTDLNSDGIRELYYEAPIFTGVMRGWLKCFDFATLETKDIAKTDVTSGSYQIILNDKGEIQAIEIEYRDEKPFSTGKIFYTLICVEGEYIVTGNEDYEREVSIHKEWENIRKEWENFHPETTEG